MQALCLQSGTFVIHFLLFNLEGEGVNFKLCPKSGLTLRYLTRMSVLFSKMGQLRE
ncbi:hypothetical protein EZS27_017130 [termite gut metagenome]|uniref:Uncharacterized protein n=1 Tax=termite gut metagenome TaxID=433724 RepID=A0A5J4RLL3_9ZZZZ